MSQMLPPIGGPSGAPAAISIGGPNHGLPAPPAPPAGASDADSGSVTDKLRQALKLVQSAAAQEGDDQDAAAITAIAASIHKAIANEQGLVDKAMGGGPGVKLVRKASAGAGGSVGGY
jgi:hypothetical protein